jgi:putative tryptophan/tyrosine transport system substrate-binding protein
VWIVYYGADLSTTPMINRALEAAQRMRLEIVPRGVLDVADLKTALRDVRRDDAVLVPEGSSPDLSIAVIERALSLRVPTAFGTALWVGHGGLMSYGPDYYAQGVQAAGLVAKILRGAGPQDLPVVGAEKIDLAVNLKTAEQLGLTVPRKILLRADAFRR